MGYEAKGRVREVFAAKQVSERFTKREFVVEIADNPKYPQLVMFEATGDRCAQLDQIDAGDEVRIEFSLRGREWRKPGGDTKYFNTLDAWKVERLGAPRAPREQASGSLGETDDLPFASCALADDPSPIAPVLR